MTPPIPLNIKARDDANKGWQIDLMSPSAEFERFQVDHQHKPGGFVTMIAICEFAANELLRRYPGRTFKIQCCNVDDNDDCGMMPDILESFLTKN